MKNSTRQSILTILLILNGACLGKVKKRRRIMTKAQYAALHPKIEEDNYETCRSAEKSSGAPVKELINRDATCKFVTVNCDAFRGTASKTSQSGTSSPVGAQDVLNSPKDVDTTSSSLVQKSQPFHSLNHKLSVDESVNDGVSIFTESAVPAVIGNLNKAAVIGVGAYKTDLGYLLSVLTITPVSDLGKVYTVVTDVTPGSDNQYFSVCTALDGSTICAGICNGQANSAISLVKYTKDFELDQNFGDGGIVITNLSFSDPSIRSSVASGVQVDLSNNIYIAGYVDFFDSTSAVMLAKYDATGKPVETFGFHGAIVYSLGGSCVARGLDLEFLSSDGSSFNLVIAGGIISGLTLQGLVGKINPITGEPVMQFQGSGFLGILINPAEVFPDTVFYGLGVAAIRLLPSTFFINVIYLAGYAKYLGTPYTLVIQLNSKGQFINSFDQNGIILVDVSNAGLESRAMSLSISRGGPVLGGYWVDGERYESSSVSFTYLGVLYAYTNRFSSAALDVSAKTKAIVGLSSGEVISLINLASSGRRGPGNIVPGNVSTPNEMSPYPQVNSLLDAKPRLARV